MAGGLSDGLATVGEISSNVLTERLRNRNTEDAETIRRRLDRVPMELGKANEFDAAVVNDVLATAIDEAGLVVSAVLSGNRNFEGRVHAQVRDTRSCRIPYADASSFRSRACVEGLQLT